MQELHALVCQEGKEVRNLSLRGLFTHPGPQGEEFTESKTVRLPFFRTVGLGHSMKFTDVLYVYRDGVDGDVGPIYLDIRKTELININDSILTTHQNASPTESL